MILARHIITTWVILLLLTACATNIRSGDVKEYRYFPEYDGYMPVVLTERKRLEVHPDWVLPATGADGKTNLQLPSTAEQAKAIVTARTRKEQWQNAALVPVQVLASPLILPAFLVADPIDHALMDKRKRDKNVSFVKFAGVKLNIRITDEKGRPVSSAQVHELPANLVYHDYTDVSGKRSFAAPKVRYYNVPTRVVKMRSRYLPVSLGRGNNQEAPNYMGYGSERYATKRAQNNNKEIAYVSQHFTPYTYYTKQGGWKWLQSPGSQTLYLVAWAPGYIPRFLSIAGVQPKTTITRSLKLKPLPNRRKMQRVAEQLNILLDDMFQGKYVRVYQGLSLDKPLVIRKWTLPGNKLATINRQLVAWLEDKRLPSYFRWNIYQILVDVARYTQDADSIRYKERFEKRAKKWFPYLGDGPLNHWRFIKELSHWRVRYCNYRSEPPRRAATGRANAAKVRGLLKTGEALDANNPYLDELRVSLALANGQRTQALSLAKHLDHADYFDYFYGCEYNIWPPRN
jgi:hypothetical protein